jgi:chromate transporter
LESCAPPFAAPPATVYAKLFLMFVKIGFLSFGGGYPMMTMIFQEGAHSVGLTASEFADMLALELLASGPVALNAATYVGYIKSGFVGTLVATAGVSVPPFLMCAAILGFLKKFGENPYAEAFLTTLKSGCGGALIATACLLGWEIFARGEILPSMLNIEAISGMMPEMLTLAACLILQIKFRANPILLVLGCAASGALFLS